MIIRKRNSLNCFVKKIKCVKVFKNGPSKICGRQPLKNLKWYGVPKLFKGCPPQYLLGSFLNTLTHISQHQRSSQNHERGKSKALPHFRLIFPFRLTSPSYTPWKHPKRPATVAPLPSTTSHNLAVNTYTHLRATQLQLSSIIIWPSLDHHTTKLLNINNEVTLFETVLRIPFFVQDKYFDENWKRTLENDGKGILGENLRI